MTGKSSTPHDDPQIQAAWDDAIDALARLLAPYVQDHLVGELARRYVHDHLYVSGWRPPLRKVPGWLEQARAARARNDLP